VQAAFGPHDLSDVRAKVGETPTTRLLSAHAFTANNRVAFAREPNLRLAAHEAAHVVQQRAGVVPAGLGRRNDRWERHADAVANAVAGGRSATPLLSGLPRRAPSKDAVQREHEGGTDTDLGAVVDRMVAAYRTGDVADVAAELQGKSVTQLRLMRSLFDENASADLARWFASRTSSTTASTIATVAGVILGTLPGATLLAPLIPLGTTMVVQSGASDRAAAETGLRRLWPALPLIDRLEIYMNQFTEIEQAQLDIIRSASAEERSTARREYARLLAVYAAMSPAEEYEARKLMDPDDMEFSVGRLIVRASGFFMDDEDPVFDAFMDLTRTQRESVWRTHNGGLYRLLSLQRFNLLQTLVHGTEAEALVARLRLATDNRMDDMDAVGRVVERARHLLREQATLRAQIASESLSGPDLTAANARLRQLGELESLLEVERTSEGDIDTTTFMGRLYQASGSGDQFGTWARSLGADPEEIAKQRIIAASGAFVDASAIQRALMDIQVQLEPGPPDETPAQLQIRQRRANNDARTRVLEDTRVQAILRRLGHQGPSGGGELADVRRLAGATRYDELVSEFDEARRALRWSQMYRATLEIAQTDAYRSQFRTDSRQAWSAYSWLNGARKDIVDRILDTRRIPINLVLESTGNVESLQAILSTLDERTRGELRLGYWLDRTERTPADDTQRTALTAFRDFERRVRASQSLGVASVEIETAAGTVSRSGVQDILDAALGAAPTEEEMDSDEGRFRAAELLYHRQRERLALRRGLAAAFSETDETMVAAAREFAALWLRIEGTGRVSTTNFAALSRLHERFEGRAREFDEANNRIGEIAGIVASTVAALVVVAATGGAATVPAIAAAAAAGASGRVFARAMFGGDHYNAASGEGARDALIGAIDGALAVASTALAARATRMIGLSGRALAHGAAETGGLAAQQATRPFGRRLAASVVENAIDGVVSGTISEGVVAMTDDRTWRSGIWQGLIRVGQAALVGGLAGLGGGAAMGAVTTIAGRGARGLRNALIGEPAEAAIERAGARETLDAARRASQGGNYDEARRLVGELEPHLNARQIQSLLSELGEPPPGAVLFRQTIELDGVRHTLKLVATQGDEAIFVLCSSCRHAVSVLSDLIQTADASGLTALKRELEIDLARMQAFETRLRSGTRVLPQELRDEFTHLAGRLRGHATANPAMADDLNRLSGVRIDAPDSIPAPTPQAEQRILSQLRRASIPTPDDPMVPLSDLVGAFTRAQDLGTEVAQHYRSMLDRRLVDDLESVIRRRRAIQATDPAARSAADTAYLHGGAARDLETIGDAARDVGIDLRPLRGIHGPTVDPATLRGDAGRAYRHIVSGGSDARHLQVASREEAEQLLRALRGNFPDLADATGFIPSHSKRLLGSKDRIFHWDDMVGADGRTLIDHPTGHDHARFRHLQIHIGDSQYRINWGDPLFDP
jgi:hypothetical protein